MRAWMWIIGATATCVASASAAPLPSAATRLLDCQKVADARMRLGCYDREAAALKSAVDAGSVAVVDKAEVRKAQRERFGLSEPGADLFIGANGARLDSVTANVASASPDTYGKWVITLADGSRWRQIDDYTLGSAPRAGQKAVVTRAALGSFKMSVAGQSGIRVRREH